MMIKRSDINVAAVTGLSVYLPLYGLFTLPDSCGTAYPLTTGEFRALLLSFAAYLLVPVFLSLLSRLRLSPPAPSWLWVSVIGSGIFALTDVGLGNTGAARTAGDALKLWLLLCAWTAPPAAGAYYFGAAVRLVKRWHRGPDYGALSFRE
jgi:hypothetical protein